jgi:hypothetical protein
VRSVATKFTLGSDNAAVTVNGPFNGLGADVVKVAVGRVTSAVRVNVFDTVLVLPTGSVNRPAFTTAVKTPLALGVSVKLYVVPDPVKLLIEQFVRVTSLEVKFVAVSDKVTFTTIAVRTSSSAVLVSVAVGGVRSAVRAIVFDATLLLPAASVNAPAGTSALNVPEASGVSEKL